MFCFEIKSQLRQCRHENTFLCRNSNHALSDSSHLFVIPDTDECSSENDCHVNATCKNTKGSYNCICLEGFQGDGRNCTGKILVKMLRRLSKMIRLDFLCFSLPLNIVFTRLFLEDLQNNIVRKRKVQRCLSN